MSYERFQALEYGYAKCLFRLTTRDGELFCLPYILGYKHFHLLFYGGQTRLIPAVTSVH